MVRTFGSIPTTPATTGPIRSEMVVVAGAIGKESGDFRRIADPVGAELECVGAERGQNELAGGGRIHGVVDHGMSAARACVR